MMMHWLDLSVDDQRDVCHRFGEPDYRVQQIAQWIFRQQVLDFDRMTNLPKSLREQLSIRYSVQQLSIESVQKSADGTQKFVFRLPDEEKIEAVLIPMEYHHDGRQRYRYTLCISTQAGCPLQCVFCATGTMRLRRNLTAGEIVEQYLRVQQHWPQRITNVVFMGMGEPLLNYNAVRQALKWLRNPWFPLLGRRRITISTAGVVPKIRQLAADSIGVKLAISLHATTDQLRSQLMPINRKWNIAQLLQAAEEYYQHTRIPVTFEYILFDQLNDSVEDARRLARFTRRFPSKVNLIPFHPIDFVHPQGLAAQLRPSPPDRFQRFVEWLRLENVVVKVRSSSGQDIHAACGQLALSVVDTSVIVPS